MNCLYEKDRKYSSLYEYVEFINVCAEGMNKFTEIFDFNDMTKPTWETIVRRLNEPIKACFSSTKHERTKKRLHIEIGNKNNEFDGILNYLQNNGNIRDEVGITYSSIHDGDPFNLLQYDNKENYFQTQNRPNSWICFEFKKHEVIPSGYIIRSFCVEKLDHLRTWNLRDRTTWSRGRHLIHKQTMSHLEAGAVFTCFLFRVKNTKINHSNISEFNKQDQPGLIIVTVIIIY